MLTRIEVDGFKNLVDFTLDFGPYTCIAGVNGVGKSNIFDAIRFLSLLTDHTINQAALQIRSPEQGTGEIGDLFFSASGQTRKRITMAFEMIVDSDVVDDFGRPGVASSTFLRYGQEPRCESIREGSDMAAEVLPACRYVAGSEAASGEACRIRVGQVGAAVLSAAAGGCPTQIPGRILAGTASGKR